MEYVAILYQQCYQHCGRYYSQVMEGLETVCGEIRRVISYSAEVLFIEYTMAAA